MDIKVLRTEFGPPVREIEEILELSRIYSTEAPKSHKHSSCSYINAEKFLKAICFDYNLV